MLAGCLPHMDRRAALAGGAITLSTLLGGCLSDDSTPPADENGDPARSTGTSRFSYESFQVGALRATHNPLDGDIAVLEVFTSAATVYESLPLDAVSTELRDEELAQGQPGAVETFVDETAYATKLIVSVITRWPKSNPSGIEIRELDRDGGTITGTAAATGESPDVGDDAPTYPVVLLRVTVGEERPDSIELSVTDGSETTDTVAVAVQ